MVDFEQAATRLADGNEVAFEIEHLHAFFAAWHALL
jgi:hypothetical protein